MWKIVKLYKDYLLYTAELLQKSWETDLLADVSLFGRKIFKIIVLTLFGRHHDTGATSCRHFEGRGSTDHI